MRPHHQRAIEKLTEHLKKKPQYLALIIAGSVAKEVATENADIDIIVVVTDEEFEKRIDKSIGSMQRLQYIDVNLKELLQEIWMSD